MKKYFIITYGCQMNYNDSERWAYKLEKQGYKPAEKMEQADLVLINMCSVRQKPVDKVYQKINYLNSLKKKTEIILTGCILKEDKEKLKNKVDKILPIIDFNSPCKYKFRDKAFVPIMTGCNNFCSYCVVPYTRGPEKSRPADEIIKEVKNLIKKGYKEITLLGQNVNSYSYNMKHVTCNIKYGNGKINFPKLLRLINDLKGNFSISFLTSHPKDMSDELIEAIAKCEKVKKYIHLPVQSGDNEILKKMNRNYTVEHYKELVKKIRKKIPKVVLTTDIIVGFPGETEKQFENTKKLVEEIKFDNIYVARYSPRPGTAAFKMKDDVSPEEKMRRKKILEEILANQK